MYSLEKGSSEIGRYVLDSVGRVGGTLQLPLVRLVRAEERLRVVEVSAGCALVMVGAWVGAVVDKVQSDTFDVTRTHCTLTSCNKQQQQQVVYSHASTTIATIATSNQRDDVFVATNTTR
jgi:hypothetical protein